LPQEKFVKIDLNCDCGESFGAWEIGADAALLPHVTSANVACGAHAGDPDVMRLTVRLARELGVAVGAHPGYPDLQGFGRRALAMSPEEIEASVLAQIGALYAVARAEGVELAHVKPHGALANQAAVSSPIAVAIARAVAAFSPELIFVALAGSAMAAAGAEAGLRVAREAYADRAYEADGTLRSRRLPGALLHDERCLAQVLSIVANGYALTVDGQQVPIAADSICLHGDTPGAAERAAFLRAGLERAGVEVTALNAVLSR
jgi:5-oxoprolinase (ATP-hydrolysing) subunit A